MDAVQEYELFTVYVMISALMATPVTTPEELPIVATPVAALQCPPPAASVRVIVDPTHTPVEPEIEPAEGNALTVTGYLTGVPHEVA